MKIHHGHYTLGPHALCGRKITCKEALTLREKEVTCAKCLDAIFR
jgi:hypothetical protein